MMHRQRSRTWAAAVFGIAILMPGAAWAVFNSGSTGADGAFVPTASVEVPLSGIFNFTTVNIPAGVTVTFAKNAANTPVVILATGDVTIAGTIDISGESAQPAGGPNLGDHTLPGIGGPGGYDGGRGGLIETDRRAGNGLGPGGGGGGTAPSTCCSGGQQGGGGGGYNGSGNPNAWANTTGNTGFGGASYGSNLLLPLIGGSGGGGGAGGTTSQAFGSGGGGGGGAILIAANGTATVTGSILARGGNGGNFVGTNVSIGTGCVGGGGSGGAVRIVASNIVGNASAVSVSGGQRGNHSNSNCHGGTGAGGRVSFEVAQSGTVFVTGLPTLRITSVAGVATPAEPTGHGDINLPAETPNPVTVAFETTGVPITNTVKLTTTPLRGTSTTVVSPTLTGSTALATTSVSVDLPAGSSTLFATTSFSIVASVGDALSQFAEGERVEQIELAASLGGPPLVNLVTVSGKKYTVPYSTIASVL